MRNPSRCLAATGVLGALVAVAVPAFAADPSSGKLSNSSPKVDWTGESNGYGYYPLHSIAQFGTDEPCSAPFCDTFALEVVDSGDVTITADNVSAGGPGSDSIEIDVIRPDGSITFNESADGKPLVVKIKAAPKGTYELRVITNENLSGDGTYKASAMLGSAAVPAAPVASPTAPGTTTGSSSAPAANLSLTTKSASAKKSSKALKLGISTSAPVTDVVATLKKGSSTIASAKLAKLDKAAKLTLKLKKPLKAGSYTVVLKAKQGTRMVALSAKLKVTK